MDNDSTPEFDVPPRLLCRSRDGTQVTSNILILIHRAFT